MTQCLNRQILVLDSGVGGLTVLQEIKRALPELICHYLADNAFYPYGTKSEVELQQRLYELIKTLLHKHKLEAIVIACNSASTAVLDYLRSCFDIPFVGVVPAIKPAAELSKRKNIGLLATEGTIQRAYTEQLIQQFANDCDVKKMGSQLLVQLAERKLSGEVIKDQELLSIVEPLVSANVDVIVLGCTHFPWFKQELRRIYPAILWLDSGEAIARRVKQLMQGFNKQWAAGTLLGNFYFTGQSYTLDLSLLKSAGIEFSQQLKL